MQAGTSLMDLERVVLFIGHQFNPTVTYFSELEVEDAKVSGGANGGEVSFEQAYLKFALDRNDYLTAGLFLPRIGIMNEDHLPTSFYGNERTQVETWILPSTWRELGVGLYGVMNAVNYSVALVNGLNSATFQHGSGIREGRFEGRNASANNLALTGSLQWRENNLKTQLSAYYGGTVGLTAHSADSLGLTAGLFGTPVAIGELDAEYNQSAFRIRILGAVISIPDAYSINRAYGNNTPKTEYGAYAEVGYNLLQNSQEFQSRSLIAFVRYERLDINASIPANGQLDDSLNQSHFVFGLNYFPLPSVVIKADMRLMHTAQRSNITFLNLGVGFSF
jgi:hypothetical protein